MMAKYDVKKILVNNESFADILFYDAFQKMKQPLKWLKKVYTPLIKFSRNLVVTKGVIV